MIHPGDLVVALGQNGVFQVAILSKDRKTAEIELFDVSKQKPMDCKMSIPMSALSTFTEDASEIAARIVREATEH